MQTETLRSAVPAHDPSADVEEGGAVPDHRTSSHSLRTVLVSFVVPTLAGCRLRDSSLTDSRSQRPSAAAARVAPVHHFLGGRLRRCRSHSYVAPTTPRFEPRASPVHDLLGRRVHPRERTGGGQETGRHSSTAMRYLVVVCFFKTENPLIVVGILLTSTRARTREKPAPPGAIRGELPAWARRVSIRRPTALTAFSQTSASRSAVSLNDAPCASPGLPAIQSPHPSLPQ